MAEAEVAEAEAGWGWDGNFRNREAVWACYTGFNWETSRIAVRRADHSATASGSSWIFMSLDFVIPYPHLLHKMYEEIGMFTSEIRVMATESF